MVERQLGKRRDRLDSRVVDLDAERADSQLATLALHAIRRGPLVDGDDVWGGCAGARPVTFAVAVGVVVVVVHGTLTQRSVSVPWPASGVVPVHVLAPTLSAGKAANV